MHKDTALIVTEIVGEVARATAKFPKFPPNSRSAWKAQAIIAEEAGEIAKEMLHYTDEPHKGATLAGIRQEAIQTAAVCVRFVQELDSGTLEFGERSPRLLAGFSEAGFEGGEDAP